MEPHAHSVTSQARHDGHQPRGVFSPSILPMASFIANDAPPTATIPVRIYYEDTDAGGLVHHSNYLRYFERGREHLLGCQKLTELFDESQRSFVVASMEVIYKKGALWGDLLEIRTSTIVHSPYRVEFRQDVYRQEELLVEGHVFMATVQGSGTAMKLCPFPDYILNGQVPTIPGLDTSKSSAHGVVQKKRLPPPRKNKHNKDDGWCSFGNGKPCLMTVYLDDTDFTGISYNANYLKWMERARADAIGIQQLAALRQGNEQQGIVGVGAAIYKATLKFKRGAKFGDCVCITTKAKLESEYRVGFKHELRLWENGNAGGGGGAEGNETKMNATSSATQMLLPTAEQIQQMPLLVEAEISLVFLNAGGNGNLVKLPSSVTDMLK